MDFGFDGNSSVCVGPEKAELATTQGAIGATPECALSFGCAFALVGTAVALEHFPHDHSKPWGNDGPYGYDRDTHRDHCRYAWRNHGGCTYNDRRSRRNNRRNAWDHGSAWDDGGAWWRGGWDSCWRSSGS